eukprot:4057302-Amphidinium_carterae.1
MANDFMDIEPLEYTKLMTHQHRGYEPNAQTSTRSLPEAQHGNGAMIVDIPSFNFEDFPQWSCTWIHSTCWRYAIANASWDAKILRSASAGQTYQIFVSWGMELN